MKNINEPHLTNGELPSASLTTAPIYQSYLNNDNIDELKPQPRRKRVSSLSLSDQYAGSLQGLTKLDKELESISVPKFLSIPDNTIKIKKEIIEHERISSYAFAFDIDGVLVKGPDTIADAKKAIQYLNGANKYNIRVPYIFVTNGGGRHERKRAEELSKRLECEITEDQVIQGHTPMKDLVGIYNNVLVVGGVGDTCRKVAEEYGFKNAFIPLDIMNWDPSVSPYYNLTDEDKACCKKDVDFSKIKFDAILVFADSRNWAADQQIILELLMSKGGYMGTVSESFDDGPGIYFAHSDFVWSTNYKLVRYGMGALQVSIAALFREHTGKELKVTRFGKPQRGTFKYAEKVLKSWRKDVLEEHVEEKSSSVGDSNSTDIFSNDDDFNNISQSKSAVFSDSDTDEDDGDGLTIQKLSQLNLDLPPPSTVYFVGDTPESDIRFANSHDESWYSILVKTGVYQENSIPKYKPKHMCDNVLDAVKFAVEREHTKELAEWNKNAIGGN